MKEQFNENKITLIEVDVTKVNGAWAFLKENFNRSNIPVNLMYPADVNRPPIILSATLTQSTVLEAIEVGSG